MITTVKSINNTGEYVTIPTVHFLILSGDLKEESALLNTDNPSQGYVSKEDYNKYGKIQIYENKSKYFLKQFRGGRPGELLVDPYGMFAKSEDLSTFSTQRGHRFCEYVEVTPEIFDHYVAYLKTRDSRYIRYCEKYILDKVI